MEAKDLINWSALSQYLTDSGSKQSIRSNNIPDKYKDEVKELLTYIEAWRQRKELTTKETLKLELEDEVRKDLLILVEKLQKYVKEPFINS